MEGDSDGMGLRDPKALHLGRAGYTTRGGYDPKADVEVWSKTERQKLGVDGYIEKLCHHYYHHYKHGKQQ